MTMKTLFAVLIIGMFLTAVSAIAETRKQPYARARLTACVLDEEGKTVSNARLNFVFCEEFNRDALVKIEGVTGDDGAFSAEGFCDGGFGANIMKEGYYDSGVNAPKLRDIQDGRWLPWNSITTTVLRPVGKPIPLYAKCVRTEIPVLNKPCGFDLEMGDWVSPYGKGKHADFVFSILREYRDRLDFLADGKLAFSNPRDGILQVVHPPHARVSRFRWQRSAPQDGFTGNHMIHIADYPQGSGKHYECSFDGKRRDKGYFFRVRTIEQNGEVIAASYGKIDGDIGIDPRNSKTCSISFTYYLNPTTLDRNMEWDPKRNLIPSLSWEENPREP